MHGVEMHLDLRPRGATYLVQQLTDPSLSHILPVVLRSDWWCDGHRIPPREAVVRDLTVAMTAAVRHRHLLVSAPTDTTRRHVLTKFCHFFHGLLELLLVLHEERPALF